MHYFKNFKILLFISYLFLNCTSYSQGDASIQIGINSGYSTSKSFKAFSAEYNELNANQIKKNLGNPNFTYGWHIQGAYKTDGLYSGISVIQSYSGTQAIFNSGTKRVIRLSQTILNAYIGYRHEGDKTEFAIYTGFSFANTFVTAFLQYTNGKKDYVGGQVDGTYHAVGFGGPLAIEESFNLNDHISLYAKIEGIWKPSKLSYFRPKSGSINTSFKLNKTELTDDNIPVFLQIGVKYNFL